MSNVKSMNRRRILKTGIASIITASFPRADIDAAIRPKAKGEIKVIYLGGDFWHNGITQEIEMRRTFSNTDWRLIFAHHDQFITPEVLKDTDLFIMLRTTASNFLGYTADGLVENRPRCRVLTEEQEDAIIDNVVNRGMGFLALHATCLFASKKNFRKIMGIDPIMHGPIQTVHMQKFNQNHPITKGIGDFDVEHDENFGVKIVSDKAISLFESTGRDDGRTDIAGWCIEAGKGRIAGLLAGHSHTAWRHPIYRQLHWRAAFWAMKREIPNFKEPKNLVF